MNESTSHILKTRFSFHLGTKGLSIHSFSDRLRPSTVKERQWVNLLRFPAHFLLCNEPQTGLVIRQ